MTTSILFTHSGGTPVPSVFSIPVAQGDTFEMSVAGDGEAVIFFSPELAAIVSPAPGTSVALSPGSTAAFTFLSSGPGAYSLVAARKEDAAPTRFASVPSHHVKIDSTFQSHGVAFPVSGGGTASNN